MNHECHMIFCHIAQFNADQQRHTDILTERQMSACLQMETAVFHSAQDRMKCRCRARDKHTMMEKIQQFLITS